MVFQRNKQKVQKSYNVGLTLSRSGTKGVVGIEIEVEGKKLPVEKIPSQWRYEKDGSLRGEENAEYVLAHPIQFNEVDQALEDLWNLFRMKGSHLDESNRTSVHVHLNVQDFHLNRLTSLMAMYFVLEEVLTEWCGEHRVGNLFCLRAKDAPAIITQIRRFVASNMQTPLKDHHHYAGLNTNAIHKFGSLEFRALRGVSDPDVIRQWVGILQRLYELSAEYPDPRALCDLFSCEGPTNFFDNMLGEYSGSVRKAVSMTEDQIRDSMYEGIRLAQDICYARDWTVYTPVEYTPDPFRRRPPSLEQAYAEILGGTPVFAPSNVQFTPSPPPPLTEEDYWEVPEPDHYDED